jgi:hypothetical protein
MKISKIMEEIIDEFNEVANKAQYLAIFVRDINLQKEEVAFIDLYIDKIARLLEKDTFTDTELNLLLFFKMSIEAVQDEIQMIICLKENQTSLAWEFLIKAQSTVSIALLNHPSNSKSLEGFMNRLESYEKVLFPKIMFSSIGGIIKESTCNLCKNDYENCSHIKGKFYKGKLCVREIQKIDLEEISLVENPASKLHIQLGTDYKGKSVDVFTLL